MKTISMLLLCCALAFAAYQYYAGNGEAVASNKVTALQVTGDTCMTIAEKAAMHLPDRLPFQRLEKSARQVRVMKSCMSDRGYVENAKWQGYAQPVASANAQRDQVSESEALETIRRIAVYQFTQNTDAPLYWVLAKAK